MKKTAIEIYALLVCLGAMACLSINIGLMVYDVVSLIKPSLTISDYQYIKHQNNNNYWQYSSGHSAIMEMNEMNEMNNVTRGAKKTNNPMKRPAEDKLTQQRDASYQSVLAAKIRSAQKDIIREFIIIFISSILFFVHWRFVLHKKNV